MPMPDETIFPQVQSIGQVVDRPPRQSLVGSMVDLMRKIERGIQESTKNNMAQLNGALFPDTQLKALTPEESAMGEKRFKAAGMTPPRVAQQLRLGEDILPYEPPTLKQIGDFLTRPAPVTETILNTAKQSYQNIKDFLNKPTVGKGLNVALGDPLRLVFSPVAGIFEAVGEVPLGEVRGIPLNPIGALGKVLDIEGEIVNRIMKPIEGEDEFIGSLKRDFLAPAFKDILAMATFHKAMGIAGDVAFNIKYGDITFTAPEARLVQEKLKTGEVLTPKEKGIVEAFNVAAEKIAKNPEKVAKDLEGLGKVTEVMGKARRKTLKEIREAEEGKVSTETALLKAGEQWREMTNQSLSPIIVDVIKAFPKASGAIIEKINDTYVGFKEGRLTGLKGMEGGEVRPGIEKAAPLPEVSLELKPQELIMREVKTEQQLAEAQEKLAEKDIEVQLTDERLKGFDRDELVTLRKVNRMLEKTKGDIETLRKSDPDLVNNAIEKVQEINKGMSEEEAVEFIRDIPTREQIQTVRKERKLTQQEANKLKRRIEALQPIRKRIEKNKAAQKVKSDIIQYAKDIPLRERGKLLVTIKNAKTQKDLNNAVEKIMELQEFSERKSLVGKIEKELKTIKPKRVKGVLTGKFTVETQNKLNAIKKLINADKDILVQAMSDKMAKEEGVGEDFMQEMELLNFADIKNQTIHQLQNTFNNIKSLKEKGQTLRELKRQNKLAERETRIDLFAETVRGGKEALKTQFPAKPSTFDGFMGTLRKNLDNYYNQILSYEWILDKLSQKSKQYEILEGPLVKWGEQGRRQDVLIINDKMLAFGKINEGIAKSFDFQEGTKAAKVKYVELFEERNLGTFTDAFAQKKDFVMTSDQLMKLSAMLRDETLLPTFKEIMGMTDEMIGAVDKALTPEEKKFVDFALDEFFPNYFEGYDGVSLKDVYEDMFGVPFNRSKNYVPIEREGVTTQSHIEELMNYVQSVSTKPGQIKARVANKNPIKTTGLVETMVKYVDDMARFKHLAPYVNESRAMFGSKEFSDALQYTFRDGLKYKRLLNNSLNDIYRGRIDGDKKVEWLDTLRGNTASGMLSLNLTQLPKQLTSVFASMQKVPMKEWGAGFTEFFKNPVQNYKKLSDSKLLQARYKQADFDQDIARARKNDWLNKLSGKTPLREKLMIVTKIGDRLGIVGAGYPVYRHSYNEAIKTMSQQEAHKKAIEAFEDNFSRTQASAKMLDMGEIQRSGSWGSLWTLFMNTPIQYNRFALTAAKNLAYGKGSKAKNAKTFFIFWSLLPVLFGLASHPEDIWQVFQGGAEGKRARRRIAVNTLAGGTQYQIIFGSMLYNIARGIAGLPMFQGSDSPVPFETLGEIDKVAKKFLKSQEDGYDWEDIGEAVLELDKVVSYASGMPVSNVASLLTNYYKTIMGDEINPLELFGYSDYALDKGYWKPKGESAESIKDVDFNKIDFSKMDFATPDLSGADLSQIDFNQIEW